MENIPRFAIDAIILEWNSKVASERPRYCLRIATFHVTINAQHAVWSLQFNLLSSVRALLNHTPLSVVLISLIMRARNRKNQKQFGKSVVSTFNTRLPRAPLVCRTATFYIVNITLKVLPKKWIAWEDQSTTSACYRTCPCERPHGHMLTVEEDLYSFLPYITLSPLQYHTCSCSYFLVLLGLECFVHQSEKGFNPAINRMVFVSLFCLTSRR